MTGRRWLVLFVSLAVVNTLLTIVEPWPLAVINWVLGWFIGTTCGRLIYEIMHK